MNLVNLLMTDHVMKFVVVGSSAYFYENCEG